MSDIQSFPQIHPARLPRHSRWLHKMCFYPVLLTQGPWIKARTPRLPEPEGVREGVLGEGPDLRVLIAGDSSAAGVGVDTQDDALSGQLTRRLARRARVDWQLVAKCGNTTPTALRQLQKAQPRPVDVAVVGLGVNDITSGATVSQWLRRTDALIDHLRGDLGAQQVYLAGIPPLWQFPVLQNPLRWTLGHQAERFDRALRQHLAARGDATWITLDMGLSEDNMAPDGFHPGPVVYAEWARAVADRIFVDRKL
ncbi:SGNH/GDSL hydrolase family protein [Thalassorhabdomicrobium marinisediminis]|uniref:GDSL family lipase n=1 Tax=Thalassorhabdomicrobium marinisediminis TaxID=2170577 RepID=A0A2T7FX20_9RHOB|nr:SGNH/GDSL hydrolase family protein [Thalassorhabdomicrobium marinisediminis]PVA06694.1 GDSL family lipase [Thalassorhabdomicrobium marinisediminis]